MPPASPGRAGAEYRAVAVQTMLAARSDAVVVLDNERLLGIIAASGLAASLA